MEKTTLISLERLNQLRLSDEQRESILAFFAQQQSRQAQLDAINTDNVERMVHVMPIMTVVREDVIAQNFALEDLQRGAPETDEGYWCVPRVVE
jgi:aspartyl-tRNA(Asn)/glutamyl-tRNA(Gln) amidotransferase subunit C